MSDPPDPEQLRVDALSFLSSERARTTLERANLRLLPAALSWEGSHGEVQGHRLVLGLDGASLGELDEHPASLDEMEEALARAVARNRGHSLAGLDTRWELEPSATSRTYRSPERRPASRHDPEALRRALVGYLEQRQQPEALQWAQEAASLDPQRAPARLRGVLQDAMLRLMGPRPEP